jgi:nucleoside-diphosphate-sugar epimerase
MRVVVTGGLGKVGRAAVDALLRGGQDVTAVDLARPVYERAIAGGPRYVRADVTDAGQAFDACSGADAVVHAAAIPDGFHDPPHVVFATNVTATWNTLEAAVAAGASRFVYVSSETVPGFLGGDRPADPRYVPVDEAHPVAPQDAYAVSKHVGETLMDAAVRRAAIACISLRPSWVQWEGNYERSLGPVVRDPEQCGRNLGSYVDVHDLADAIRLAVESDLPGHEVVYVAAPDNAAGRPLVELARRAFRDRVEIRHDLIEREDASGISSAKARRLLGWSPRRSWRDYLDDEGRLRAGVAAPP